MSRCYPFPPPGYARNGIRDEALIESIKREEVNARKERKKDRKERKRERKERKKKAKQNGELESKKLSNKRKRKDEGTKEDQKARDHNKRKDNETEPLDKSSLTEEHHLVGSQNSCDSTLNSNKKQKESPPPDGRHNSESIIRIRLPVKRQKDPEVLTSKEQQPCSSRGRVDDVFEPTPRLGREWVEYPCSTSTYISPEPSLRLSEENRASPPDSSKQFTVRFSKEKRPSPPSSSLEQPTLRVSKDKQVCPSDLPKPSAQELEAVQPSNICGSCPPSVAIQFWNLIENWVPSPIQNELSEHDDQEWLRRPKNLAKKCEVSNISMNQGNATTWPSACFLPEADVYALPFTVPY